jgi:hypothetical protein
MKKALLREYEFRELGYISDNSAAVVERGRIVGAQDLYPDLSWPKNIAFPRGRVPLPILFLLHEKLVLYVPPASRSVLERRWGMSMATITQLAREGFVQPLIGHAPDYHSKHFEELLELQPPSVWARGLGLLRALGMEETLERASVDLPIGRIASLAWVRERWKRHFPEATERELTGKIRREVSTQYADLWIFGHEGIARGLAHLETPSRIAQALFLANETRTFPLLFGLGGTAHYDIVKVRAEPSLLDSEVGTSQRVVVPSELGILLKGMGIDLDTLSAKDIVEFHATGCGAHLRHALSDFGSEAEQLVKSEEKTTDRLFESAARLQDAIKEANVLLADPEFRQAANRTQTRVQWLLRAGGLAVGAWVGNVLQAGWLEMLVTAEIGMKIVEKLVPEEWRDKVVNTSVAQQFSPGIAHLWRVVETHGTDK